MEISKESIDGMRIDYVEVSHLPMINTDLEVDGKYPPAVEQFRRKILQCDSILFASPEYNYSVSRNPHSFNKPLLLFTHSSKIKIEERFLPS